MWLEEETERPLFCWKMERVEFTENAQGETDLLKSPYSMQIYRLRQLDVKHIKLQRALHAGEISPDQFLIGYRRITRSREIEIVDAAIRSINTNDTWANTSAFNVLVSFATEGHIRPMAQFSFLRVSGIASFLPVLK